MYANYDEDCCRVAKFDGKVKVKLVEWKVAKDVIVAKGSILFVYDENGVEKKYKSVFVGTVVELFVEESYWINPGDDLLMYQICLHPTVMKDMCAECGEDLRQTQKAGTQKVAAALVSMVHTVPELMVSVEHAEKLGKADVKRLNSVRKLVLLVDLDQTLIHTTYEHVAPDVKNLHRFQLYGGNTCWYHTKIRPHTDQFLNNISQLFELHIFTFGVRMYAHKIASILDPPPQKFFSHRILSRDECFDPSSKTGNLKALFPCGDSMVCIIDDREDVWNFAPNLITVKPYIYFKNTGDINSPYKPEIENQLRKAQEDNTPTEELKPQETSAPDKSDVKTDGSESIDKEVLKEEPTKEKECFKQSDDTDGDDYLLYLEDILRRIHAEYFQLYDQYLKNTEKEKINPPDLKEIVPRLRKQSLCGVRLVFSGVIPTNTPPERSKLWALAVSLGAEVQKDIVVGDKDSNTTHLIAAKFGTLKVNKAIKHGIKIVNPSWLVCVAERWEHVDERLFRLEKDSDFSDQYKVKSKSQNEILKEEKTSAETLNNPPKPEPRNPPVLLPVYDPLTGKRINVNRAVANPSPQEQSTKEVTNEVEPHDMLDFSPLSAFSKNDLRMMDKEVDDACSEGDEMSTGNTDSSAESDEQSKTRKRALEESSSDENSSEECPRGWKSKRIKRTANADEEETRESFAASLPSDSSDDFNESIGSVDEEMAAAVEREFLS